MGNYEQLIFATQLFLVRTGTRAPHVFVVIPCYKLILKQSWSGNIIRTDSIQFYLIVISLQIS